ncbi:MAG TPA: DUF3891 family protein [Bryobacteraceae bacterium]
MIRRRVGDEFWLIPQDDHARISGELAHCFGANGFAKPQAASSVLGISMHDCGWPIHDDRPTLNKDRLPLDVFETSPQIGLAVWTESARRAVAQDDYAGLLVSMHSLSLSALATSQVFDNDQFNINDARVRFEVNKFQHTQIELQENLRRKAGLHTDIPLHLGVAEKSKDPREQSLEFDFRLLQAMDKLSLCICCTRPPFAEITPMPDRPGGKCSPLSVQRPEPNRLVVRPWPFAGREIKVKVPYRGVRAGPFADQAEFLNVYGAAAVQHFECNVTAG